MMDNDDRERANNVALECSMAIVNVGHRVETAIRDLQQAITGAQPTHHHKPAPTDQIAAERFADFWKVYPKKVAKKPATAAYIDAVRAIIDDCGCGTLDAEAYLIDAATEYAASEVVADGRYVCNPQTWLAQERYNDDRRCWMLRSKVAPINQ